VIMVGEMARSRDGGPSASRRRSPGNLVFSTLHTNSAPETITRPARHGHRPRSTSPTRLLGIMAQRLIRVLCAKCKEAYHPTPEEYEEIIEAYGYDWWPSNRHHVLAEP